jgi:hypothetical protein
MEKISLNINEFLIEKMTQYIEKTKSFDSGLPIASRDTAWDAGQATKAMEHLATSATTGKIDFNKFGKGFMWYDEKNPELVGSYKLPFCDVINGKLTVIPRALIAILGRLNQTDIPTADKDKVKNIVAKYYNKIGMDMPKD